MSLTNSNTITTQDAIMCCRSAFLSALLKNTPRWLWKPPAPEPTCNQHHRHQNHTTPAPSKFHCLFGLIHDQIWPLSRSFTGFYKTLVKRGLFLVESETKSSHRTGTSQRVRCEISVTHTRPPPLPLILRMHAYPLPHTHRVG